MKTITVVAKGPSAANADRYIAEHPGTHIACVNDAFKLIHTHAVQYCFFTHIEFAHMIAGEAERFGSIVCPNLMQHENQPPPPEIVDKLIQYESRKCAGSVKDLVAKIVAGGITHHNTVNGSLHWLAKHGRYEKIRIIGVDGGRMYAPGVGVVSEKTHSLIVKGEGTEDYFDTWKGVTVTLCGVLKQIYGVEFEWYGD